MRLWSLHPKYLDTKGIVALWREGLLAQKVLAGKTKGYRRHPQLLRFQEHPQPLAVIGSYLTFVHVEAVVRNYSFNVSKILLFEEGVILSVTEGQIQYEWEHLQKKLKRRDPLKHQQNLVIQSPECHPLFHQTSGGIASWEIISK